MEKPVLISTNVLRVLVYALSIVPTHLGHTIANVMKHTMTEKQMRKLANVVTK